MILIDSFICCGITKWLHKDAHRRANPDLKSCAHVFDWCPGLSVYWNVVRATVSIYRMHIDSDYEASSSFKSESGQESKSEARGPSTLARPRTRRAQSQQHQQQATGQAHAHTNVRIRPASATVAAAAKNASRRSKPQGDPERKARRPPSRICKFDGCDQYVVDQGLCVRHGVRALSDEQVSTGGVVVCACACVLLTSCCCSACAC